MSQLPPSPEDNQDRAGLIEQGGHLAHWLIGQIAGFLVPQAGKFFDRPYLRWLMRHYVLPAEAVLRRAIHLMAGTLPPLVLSLKTQRPAHLREGGGLNRSSPKPRTPQFRLTESLPRPSTNYIPVSQRPRISVPGMTPRNSALPQTGEERAAPFEARVRRRLAALEAAWNDPRKAALRLQRLRARGAVKSPALCFAKIPGAGAQPVNDVAAAILHALNNLVFEDAAGACVKASANTS
jgi:hypothetical protein